MPIQPSKKISEDMAARITEALVLHKSRGLSMAGALDQAGVNKSWYYELRRTYPDEMAALSSAAERLAVQQRAARRSLVLVSQEDRALTLYGKIMGGLEDALDNLCRIAKGAHEVVTLDDGTEKTLYTYPRDAIGAFEALRAAAFEGLLPEGVLQQNDEDKAPAPPPVFPGLDFKRVEATASDGTTVTVERPEVVEGDYEEV